RRPPGKRRCCRCTRKTKRVSARTRCRKCTNKPASNPDRGGKHPATQASLTRLGCDFAGASTMIAAPESHQDLRDAVRDLCAQFPDSYFREVDAKRGYPDAFVDALTKAG